MKDEKLESVDENLVGTGKFLEEIVDHPFRTHCLQAFVESQEIIKWLQNTTNSKLCFVKSF